MLLACMPFAVSSSSLVNLALVFVLAVMSHLDQKSILEGPVDFLGVGGDPQRGGFPQRRQLIVVDVVQLVFGEANRKTALSFDRNPISIR